MRRVAANQLNIISLAFRQVVTKAKAKKLQAKYDPSTKRRVKAGAQYAKLTTEAAAKRAASSVQENAPVVKRKARFMANRGIAKTQKVAKTTASKTKSVAAKGRAKAAQKAKNAKTTSKKLKKFIASNINDSSLKRMSINKKVKILTKRFKTRFGKK